MRFYQEQHHATRTTLCPCAVLGLTPSFCIRNRTMPLLGAIPFSCNESSIMFLYTRNNTMFLYIRNNTLLLYQKQHYAPVSGTVPCSCIRKNTIFLYIRNNTMFLYIRNNTILLYQEEDHVLYQEQRNAPVQGITLWSCIGKKTIGVNMINSLSLKVRAPCGFSLSPCMSQADEISSL